MMRPRIQIRVVGEQMKYLEEQMQLMEPVIGLMKNAIENSKTWIEDINDNPSITYIELCQELASATTTLLDVASNILGENKEYVDSRTPSLSQSTLELTATVKRPQSESISQVNKLVENPEEIFTRLGLLENSIDYLQGTTKKYKDDISEIKQWRDNFVTEQSEIGVNIEQLTKKQKQNFKNLRKQINEQDNKVKELNKEIENLKEKESNAKETLEKLSLDMKGYEKNLHKINKEFQDYTDKIDSITQEINRHSDLMAALQEECNKILCNTSTQLEKQNVLYKLLQQRLMPIDKLIQIFNQNLETREERITKIETIKATISVLSKDLNLLESRVCNRYACQVQLAGRTPVSAGSIISTFKEVREYNGQNFNQTTGKFVSPHDSLYLVCVTLNTWGDGLIKVGVSAGERGCATLEVKCADTNAAGSVVVDMKKGQELYFKVIQANQGATLSNYSSFTIVSL